MAEYPIPKRVSADDIKNILKGYYLEGAHNEPVSTGDVEDTIQLTDRVGRQTPFLVDVGLLREEGHNRALTSDGEAIAESLVGGSSDLARSLMREALVDWDFTDKILGFIEMQEESISEDDLLDYISANASSSNKQGQRALVDLLKWVNLISETEEGDYEKTDDSDLTHTEEVDTESDQQTSEKQAEEHGGRQTSQGQSTSIGGNDININFEFSGDATPSEIEDIILHARRALEKPIEELDDDSDEGTN